MNNPDQQNTEGRSLENIFKRDAAFFANPSPCGVSISFCISRKDDGLIGASFVFDAADVQSVSTEMLKESPGMTGAVMAAKRGISYRTK